MPKEVLCPKPVELGSADSRSRCAQPAKRNAGAAIWFLAALASVMLAGVLQVGNGRQVMMPGWPAPLPETCTLRLQLGIDCPGCGLTRGFIHVAHGRVWDAFAVHPLSPPLFGLAVLQLPLALAHWIPIDHRLVRLATRCNMVCLLVLAAIMLARWIWLLPSI